MKSFEKIKNALGMGHRARYERAARRVEDKKKVVDGMIDEHKVWAEQMESVEPTKEFTDASNAEVKAMKKEQGLKAKAEEDANAIELKREELAQKVIDAITALRKHEVDEMGIDKPIDLDLEIGGERSVVRSTTSESSPRQLKETVHTPEVLDEVEGDEADRAKIVA